MPVIQSNQIISSFELYNSHNCMSTIFDFGENIVMRALQTGKNPHISYKSLSPSSSPVPTCVANVICELPLTAKCYKAYYRL